jgi:hypothetical protein
MSKLALESKAISASTLAIASQVTQVNSDNNIN